MSPHPIHPSRRRSVLPTWLAILVVFLGALPACLHAQEGRTAVIDDRDGYTNVRLRASKQSPVVVRVVDDEKFTVYPDDGDWWHVRTANGKTGFMHRSCVRLLDDPAADTAGQNADPRPSSAHGDNAPPTIRRDEATLAAWKQYTDAREEDRARAKPVASAVLPKIEAIPLDGVDPFVAAHITETRDFLRAVLAGYAQAEASLRRVQPSRDLMEALRGPARKVGGEVLAGGERSDDFGRQTGATIADLLLLYGFSDAIRARDMPDFRKLSLWGDQLVIRESFLNAALGLEQPPGMKPALISTRNRMYTERLLATGPWVCHNADGQVFDLDLKSNDVLRLKGCGFVTLKARGRRREMFERDFFKWEFQGDDFYMVEAGMMSEVIPADARKLRGVFVTSTVFKVFDEHDKLIGTWER